MAKTVNQGSYQSCALCVPIYHKGPETPVVVVGKSVYPDCWQYCRGWHSEVAILPHFAALPPLAKCGVWPNCTHVNTDSRLPSTFPCAHLRIRIFFTAKQYFSKRIYLLFNSAILCNLINIEIESRVINSGISNPVNRSKLHSKFYRCFGAI